jgi:penicillin-binding protein 1A
VFPPTHGYPPYPFSEPEDVPSAARLLGYAAFRGATFLGQLIAAWWASPGLRFGVPTLALATLLGGSAAHRIYFDRTELPDLEPFVRFEPPTTGEVRDTEGRILIEVAREYRRVVEYREVPPIIRDAILAAEDQDFFRHAGIDYLAFPRVAWKALAHSAAATRRAFQRDGTLIPAVVVPQGGSTVTQQLVRGYFLSHLTQSEDDATLASGSWWARAGGILLGSRATNKLTRKIEEARLSLWLEDALARRLGSRRRAKEEILARYASFIYLGNGRYGFAAASEYYFGKPLGSYTSADADKAALLAGITKSPADYAPGSENSERAWRRRNSILALMAEHGTLSAEDAARSAGAPIRLAERPKVKTEAPAVIENVFAELKALGVRDPRLGVEALVQGRIRVQATVDDRIQRIVNEALEEGLRQYEQRHRRGRGLVQGSVVVLRNADGAILAESGGRQVYKDRVTAYSDFNRVTDSLRQPGSVMKPIVYLAAFRKGATLDTLVPDEPIAVDGGPGQPPKWINNYDYAFKGVIPIRQALAESRNAATIWIAQDVGLDKVMETARAVGIRTPLQPYITTALGASEVLADPHIIQAVSDRDGQVIHRHRGAPRRLGGGTALREIQEGLRCVVRMPGGTAHALVGLDVAVMGKTGTSSDFRDALFVGSSYGRGGITVAVRVGYDDNRELGARETGGRTALPIFRQIMQNVYEEGLVGPAPRFPEEMEARIDQYLADTAEVADTPAAVPVALDLRD